MPYRGSIFKHCHEDPNFKARLLKNPQEVLKQEGFNIPKGWNIRFVEEPREKTLTIHIPKLAKGENELDLDQLQKIVGGISDNTMRDPGHYGPR